jgi:alkylated DNA repair dioxygenase AlkB
MAPASPFTLTPRWLDPDDADEVLARLLLQTPWEQPILRIGGRQVHAPRQTSWHGDSGCFYRYSGRLDAPRPWMPPLEAIRNRLEQETGIRFNTVLANLYRDGRDGIGWHADNERELGPAAIVASVSLGASRRFKLRRNDGSQAVDMILEHGSLLWMGPGTQKTWQHSLPRMTRVQAPRINLTYRQVRPTADPG